MSPFLQLVIQYLVFYLTVVLSIPSGSSIRPPIAPRFPNSATSQDATDTSLRSRSSPYRNSTYSWNATAARLGSNYSCADTYFDLNEKNFVEAGVADWYGNWSVGARQHPDYERMKYEPTLFVYEFLGRTNFWCGIGHEGCDNVPSCQDIQMVFLHDRETARRILFSVLMIDGVNRYATLVYDATGNAQASLSEYVPKISKTFFWHRDSKKVQKCELKKMLLNAAMQLGIEIGLACLGPVVSKVFVAGERALVQIAEKELASASKSLGRMTKSLGKATEKVGKLEEQARKPGFSTTKSFERKLGRAKDKVSVLDKAKTNRMGTHGKALEKHAKALQDEEKWNAEVKEAFLNNQPRPVQKHRYGAAYLSHGRVHFKDARPVNNAMAVIGSLSRNVPLGFLFRDVQKDCALDPSPEVSELEHNAELELAVKDMMTGYRKDISRTMDDINVGVSAGTEESLLAGLIRKGDYFALETREKLIDDPYQIEERMTNSFLAGLISDSWTTNACHMVCVEDRAKDCHNDVGALAVSRHCPVPGTICQAQCWQNDDKGRNLELYGVQELSTPPFNFTSEMVLQESWDNYMLSGFDQTSKWKNLKDKISLDEMNRRPTEFRLPVCNSDSMSIRDLTRNNDDETRWKGFPCTCGDELSSETAAFIKATGIKESKSYDHITTYCTEQLSKEGMGPAQFFIAMCELNVVWPIDYTSMPRPVQETGQHPGCQAVIAQTRAILEWGDMDDVDERFCLDSTVMRDGMFYDTEDHGLTHLKGFGSVPTFGERCRPIVISWCKNGCRYQSEDTTTTNTSSNGTLERRKPHRKQSRIERYCGMLISTEAMFTFENTTEWMKDGNFKDFSCPRDAEEED